MERNIQTSPGPAGLWYSTPSILAECHEYPAPIPTPGFLSNFSSVTGNPLAYDAITPVFPVAMKVARPLAKKQETPTYLFEHSQPQLHQHCRHLIKPDRRVGSCYGSPVKAEVMRAI